MNLSEIYKDDPAVLSIDLMIMTDIMPLLRRLKSDATEDVLYEERELINSLAKSYAHEYLDKWAEDRAYIGEPKYPVKYAENFLEFYEYAYNHCWQETIL